MANTSNMSSMSNTMRDAASSTVRDAVKDARDTAKDIGKAAASGGEDIRGDLNTLRDDVAKLTQQLADILSSRGGAAWDTARSNVEGVISGAQATGQEAVDAVREVGDNLMEAVDESLKQRPYTTLAIAAAIGFLFGATWRR
jgi:ElaB/YqjD/DUF883 family membrane-anchored ribosome-binding protein